MIIDVHTHLNHYNKEEQPSLEERLENLQREMADNGVDAAVILTSYKVNAWRPSTADVVRITRDIDNLYVVAGVSIENYQHHDLREIDDFLRTGQVVGLKIYPGYEPFYPYDERCRVLYEMAARYDVPVMIHTGDTYSRRGKLRFAHPLNVDDAAVEHPDVKFVICHIGNPWIRDCMEVVYKNANVWADVSGLVVGDFSDRFESFMIEEISRMIAYAGEPRYLLYGTDWPICSMDSYLQFMRDLDLEPDAREMIMWRNAAQLFKLPAASNKSQLGQAAR